MENINIMFFIIYTSYTIVLFIFFTLIYNNYICFLINQTQFCDFLINKKILNFNKLRLKNTNLKTLVLKCFNKSNTLFPLKEFNQSKNLLIDISSRLDEYFKQNYKKYRSVNDEILIEKIIKNLIDSDDILYSFNLFSKFKLICNNYKILKKETKISLALFAKYLILKIINKKKYLDDLLKIINKSKNAKYTSFYRNTIYFYAQMYSFCNFNNSSSKLITLSTNEINYMIFRFFSHLYKQHKQMKILLTYLYVITK